MFNFLLGSIGYLLLGVYPVLGQNINSPVEQSSAPINTAIERVVSLEKSKAEIDFCKKYWGSSFDEIDVSKMGSLEGYDMRVNVITDGLIASKYEWYGDFSKAADYYYKDYLVQIGKRQWKTKHSWSSPGDSTPFPIFMNVLKENRDYQRMLKMYPQYYDYYFFADTNRYKGSRTKKTKILQEDAKNDAELKGTYNAFMREWDEITKLAKTEKPKPLDPAVQNHEWFYSDKQEEVLKALKYYYTNKVEFMLEKALKHKDPVIAEKAKEYLENLKKGNKDEEGKK